VIALAARHKLTLETGHSSPAEGLLLVREARRAGVERIVVTHAAIAPVHMSIAQMKQAAAAGAYLEFVYNALIGPNREFTFAEYVKMIREIGPEHCILSSDLGQAANPIHTVGLEAFFAGLRQAGITQAEIDRMAKTNPARVLGLDP
jgi:predicted metal-dependent TIM-barrel fold hydrolase